MTVADELAKLGKEVDRKIIVLKDIKKVGEYVAVVRFHKEAAPAVEEAPAAVEEAPVEEAPVEEAEEAPAAE